MYKNDIQSKAVTDATIPTIDPFIGMRVRKKFSSKWYEGTVDHAWFSKDRVTQYHVLYDDGDKEDCNADKISEMLLPSSNSEKIIQEEPAYRR